MPRKRSKLGASRLLGNRGLPLLSIAGAEVQNYTGTPDTPVDFTIPGRSDLLIRFQHLPQCGIVDFCIMTRIDWE